MKFFDDYVSKKLKELDEHPERNKKSSGILEDVIIFTIHAIIWLLIICWLLFRYDIHI